MAGKAVAKKAEAGLPVEEAWGEYAGVGFENTTREDYAIPFIAVLQANSPLEEIGNHAKAGMLFNTVTNDLWPGEEGMAIVPCATHHCFVEWVPRDEGGGFVGLYELDDPLVEKVRKEQEFGKYKHPESGNDLIETFYLYSLVLTEDGYEQAIIAFTSTKIKVYKQMMMKAHSIMFKGKNGRRFPAPLFAHRFRLTTVKQKNASGTFYNFKLDFDGKNAADARLNPAKEEDKALLEAAAGLHQVAAAGEARAAYDTQQKAGDPAADSEEAPF